MKTERQLPLFLLTLFFILVTAGISRADFQGTVGTMFTVTGSDLGVKKPKVYIEYVKRSGKVKKIKAKVETWSDTSITCLWTKPVSPGTYNIWVQPDVRDSAPSVVDTFSIMNPAIDTITLDNPSNAKKITVTGWYFTNKKPKVYLKDLVSLRKKRCRVVSSSMDPVSGASSLKFIVPKWGSDNYAIVLQTRVGEISFILSSVSGTITDPSTGDGIPGVLLSLTGADSNSVLTGNDGTYSFTNIQNGSYTMTPFKSGFTFTPQNRTVIVNNANITGQDFAGIPEGSSLDGSGLDNWQVRTSGTTDTLYGVIYDNGAFVAVGDIGTILTSDDGVTWTRQNSGTSKALQGLTYGNGIFVVVGIDGTLLTSPDGVVWTSRYAGSGNLRGITYSNGTFVAVGDAGTILTSADGVIWTARVSDSSDPLYGVTYGNGSFVAIGSIGAGPSLYQDTIFISADSGLTWAQSPLWTASPLTGVTYGNDTFVAVAGIDSIRSTDGVLWTHNSSGFNILFRVIYSNDTFVAVGWESNADRAAILTSPDGVAWTPRYSDAADSDLYGVTYGNGSVVAVGSNGIILQSDPLE